MARSPFLAAACAVLLSIGLTAPADAVGSRVLPVASGVRVVPNSFIVKLTGDLPAGELAARYGGRVGRVFQHALRGFSVTMTPADAERLAADPRVAYVEPNAELHLAGTQQAPPSWGLDRVDQRDLPLDGVYTYPNTAGSVTAYVLDTGIRTSHVTFRPNRARVGFDAFGGDGQDCNGHGTHVAGTLGGAEYGVAKDVRLVSVRVLDCSGGGTVETVVAGVDWVTANHAPRAVANMSLGAAGRLPAIDDAVRGSIDSGVVYAIAAGNAEQDACTWSPAGVTEAITVGNAAIDDTRSASSNTGPCLDLFAPGEGITSAWFTSDTATQVLTATSMAAPHVAGAAAMYLEANPTATAAQVRDALVACATPDRLTDPGAGSPNRLLFVGCVAPPTALCPRCTDILVFDPSNATYAVALSDGRAFVNGRLWLRDWSGPPQLGDFDGDGRTDILVFDPSSATYAVAMSDGNAFVNGHLWLSGWSGPPQLGDFNGDGRTDILVFDPRSATYAVALSNGSAFVDGHVWLSGWSGPPQLGDFNGDGRTDILVFDPSNATYAVALSDGNAFVNGRFWLTGWSGPPQLGDFNGDGRTDILVFDGNTATYAVALSNGSAFVNGHQWLSNWSGPPRLADFDGDGRTDVLVFDPRSATYAVALSDGNAFVNGHQWLSGWSGPPQLGDFDGDGRTDILVFEPSNATYAVALSNGNAFVDGRLWLSGWSGPPQLGHFD